MGDEETIGHPDPHGAQNAAQFVALLRELRAWCGQVPLRRLRALGGSTTTASGVVVDSLPPTTVSDILAGKRLPSMPRRVFVEAFVTACLTAHGCSDEETETLLAQWVGAWQELTLEQAATPTVATPTAPIEETANSTPAPDESDLAAEPKAPIATTTPTGPRSRRRRTRWVAVSVLGALVVTTALAATLETYGHPGHRAARGSVTTHGRGTAVNLTTGLPASGRYRIQVAGSGLCLSERPGDHPDGLIYQTVCSRTFPSMALARQPGGTFRITTFHPEYGPGCMGIRWDSRTIGGAVADDFCNAGDGNDFRLEAVSRPLVGFKLLPLHDNLCVGILADPRRPLAAQNWAPARQLRCDPAATGQVFRFDPVPVVSSR